MNLNDLGYNSTLEDYRKEYNLQVFDIGRVISEHKERYVVKTTEKEYDAEIIGNLRYTAIERSDFPAVGDWVAISEYDENKALIHHVFPRKTIIERQAVGKHGEKQIIAANIDYAFIVQAVDRDFNINRIERYLAICNASKVAPIILLNKIDLIDDVQLSALLDQLKKRVEKVPVITISNETKEGIAKLKNRMEKGKTYCLLGSSGVGKSTLLNNLSNKLVMQTNTISASTHKGRHITTHRELVLLDNGTIVIDNPGMREVG
ncbi:MAG: ribosome small subunit-dependent GTPase A, partial [Flavobacteriaceae bacterium]|nr:ribosome small subunit-dependent GTPase A [Flavobacteriaceae bacterium]